jgi:hypothetical protein
LYAYCGLRENKPPHENLAWGDILHKGLEHLIRGDSLVVAVAAMREYQALHYTVDETYQHSTAQMLKLYPLDRLRSFPVQTECSFEFPMKVRGIPVLYRGKVDMLSDDWFGDHKAKGRIYPMETAEDLIHDLQMNLYAYVLGLENWQYDLIQIPEQAYRLPEKRAGQSTMEYVDWYFNKYSDVFHGFPIAKHIGQWIVTIPFYKPLESIHDYFNKVIVPMTLRLIRFWEYVCSPKFDPNNPECYNEHFYQMPARMFDPSRAEKFKPHFHDILIEKETYENLIPIRKFYPELEKEEQL